MTGNVNFSHSGLKLEKALIRVGAAMGGFPVDRSLFPGETSSGNPREGHPLHVAEAASPARSPSSGRTTSSKTAKISERVEEDNNPNANTARPHPPLWGRAPPHPPPYGSSDRPKNRTVEDVEELRSLLSGLNKGGDKNFTAIDPFFGVHGMVERIGPVLGAVQPRNVAVWAPKSVHELRARLVNGDLESGVPAAENLTVVKPEEFPLARGFEPSAALTKLFYPQNKLQRFSAAASTTSKWEENDNDIVESPPLFLVSLHAAHQGVYSVAPRSSGGSDVIAEQLLGGSPSHPSWERRPLDKLKKKYRRIQRVAYRRFWLLCHRYQLHDALEGKLRKGELTNADVQIAVSEAAHRASVFLHRLARELRREDLAAFSGDEKFVRIVTEEAGGTLAYFFVWRRRG